MEDPNVQIWMAQNGKQMVAAANSGSADVMFMVLSQVAGQIDKFITPARQASERVMPYED